MNFPRLLSNLLMILGPLFSSVSFFTSRAFVFFSSPVPAELVNHIKKDASVLSRISALREV